MQNILYKHRELWPKKEFFVSVAIGIGLLIVSLGMNYVAGTYANARASNSVTDIILSNIPALDVDGIFIQGFEIFILFLVGVLFYEPKALPFSLKNLALFIFIRSFSISLTHIGPFPQVTSLNTNSLIQVFNFNGDLFFSGHTGIPFLLALIFWKQKTLRLIFLCISILFGAVVLLGHYHYSIDVFSAFFITYTIFHLGKKLWPKDYAMLEMIQKAN